MKKVVLVVIMGVANTGALRSTLIPADSVKLVHDHAQKTFPGAYEAGIDIPPKIETLAWPPALTPDTNSRLPQSTRLTTAITSGRGSIHSPVRTDAIIGFELDAMTPKAQEQVRRLVSIPTLLLPRMTHAKRQFRSGRGRS